jgi:hypothetical protein
MAFGLKETLIAIPVMMGLASPTMAEDFVLRFGPNTLRIGPNGISVQVPQGSLQYRRESQSQGQDYPAYRARPLLPPPVAAVPPPKSPFWSPPPVAAVPPPPPPLKSPPPVAAVPPPKPPEEPPVSQIDPPAPLPEPGHIPPTSKYFGPQSKEKSRPYIQQ